MKPKIILISTLAIVELIVIFLLGTEIYNNQNSSAMIINPINKEDIIFPDDSELKHFYESLPEVTSKVHKRISLSYEPVYTINSDTLNDGSEYQIDKPKDTYRIIALGDSFTFGLYVDTFDSYPETLERLLNNTPCRNINKFEVINLGVPGYDIRYSVERFRLRGQKYNPDLVLWLLFDTDFFPQEFLKPRIDFLKENNGLGFGKAIMLAYKQALEEIGVEKMIQYEIEALNLMDKYYKNTLVFFLYAMTEDKKTVIENFARLREDTYTYVKTSRLSDEEIIPGDGHPNIAGHQTLSNELFQYITENNIIPCG